RHSPKACTIRKLPASAPPDGWRWLSREAGRTGSARHFGSAALLAAPAAFRARAAFHRRVVGRWRVAARHARGRRSVSPLDTAEGHLSRARRCLSVEGGPVVLLASGR